MAIVAYAVSGCVGTSGLEGVSAPPPDISRKMLAEMSKKGMTPESPVLVRIFKQESELEIWKMDRSGKYALLHTFPICRWSGKLGPKKRNGDRQAPEGFYSVSAGLLNPNSQFHLAFNLGYPNRLEEAHGYTGEALMVHGACSSSGCFAMTDQGIREIYPVVAKALASGQRAFQVQAFPFRMNATNMSRHMGDPNMPYWRTLKEGHDSFIQTRQAPKVSVCGGRYVFNTEFVGGEPEDPLAACPPVLSGPNPALVAKPDTTVTTGTTIASNAYRDGGMHSSYRSQLAKIGPKKFAARTSRTKYPVSRPDAALADPFAPILASEPVSE